MGFGRLFALGKVFIRVVIVGERVVVASAIVVAFTDIGVFILFAFI
jgi:hypothetical protein